MVDERGPEGTRVPTSVAADPVDRTHQEVPRRPRGGRVHLHPGIHPASNPGKGYIRIRYIPQSRLH